MPRELLNPFPYAEGKLWDLRKSMEPAIPLGNWCYGTKVTIEPGMQFLFISGIMPQDADGSVVGVDDLKTQYRKCVENMKIILESQGASLKDVVMKHIFVKDEAAYHRLGQWRAEQFPDLEGGELGHDVNKAAGTVVEVSRICHPDQLIEIDAIAVVSPKK